MTDTLDRTDDEARHAIGANNPPVPIFDELSGLAAPLIATANLWLTERPKIEDEETATKAVAFKAQIDALLAKAETNRVAEKKPHDDAAKAVQNKWRGLMVPAETVLDLLKPRISDYLRRKEAARLKAEQEAREEADRKLREAQEAQRVADELAAQSALGELTGTAADVVGAQVAAQDAVAEAKAADKVARAIETAPSNVKGAGFGRTAALRSSWSAEIEDFDKALKHFKKHPAILEAVQTLANALARSPVSREMPVPGVKFVETKGL